MYISYVSVCVRVCVCEYLRVVVCIRDVNDAVPRLSF